MVSLRGGETPKLDCNEKLATNPTPSPSRVFYVSMLFSYHVLKAPGFRPIS